MAFEEHKGSEPANAPAYLTRKQLSLRWSCSLSTVDRRLRKHADVLKATRCTGGLKVRVSDVERAEALFPSAFQPARTPSTRRRGPR